MNISAFFCGQFEPEQETKIPMRPLSILFIKLTKMNLSREKEAEKLAFSSGWSTCGCHGFRRTQNERLPKEHAQLERGKTYTRGQKVIGGNREGAREETSLAPSRENSLT